MEQVVKKYTRGDLTVVWRPALCIHSTKCWKGLGEVFDPKKRPWVNMDGAEAQRIIAQVKQCPSGALSYEQRLDAATEESEVKEAAVSVEVMKNGPLMVYGNLTIKDSMGNEHHKSRATALCRCGASANKPFCDGSHIRVGFRDE